MYKCCIYLFLNHKVIMALKFDRISEKIKLLNKQQ